MENNAQKRNGKTAIPAKKSISDTELARFFAGFVFVVAVVMGLRALAIMSDFNALSYRLAALGWGKFAEIIVQNRISALWHAVFMTVCAGVFIWLFCGYLASARLDELVLRSLAKGGSAKRAKPGRIRNQYVRNAAQWLLVVIVAADAFFLSRHYIKTMPLKAFEENDVIRVLKTALPEKRAVLLSQDGFYNLWLTYLFPYHGIKTMNFTQMPRMPDDYRKFFEAVDRNPLRKWQLSAVGFVLAPAQVWGQFQNDPAIKEAFEIVYAYNVKPLLWRGKPADACVEVIPATAEQPGQHVIMRLLKPAPRFALIGAWETVDDVEVLRRLGAKDYQPFKEVMLGPESALKVSKSEGSSESGQLQVLAFSPGKINLRTSSTCPAILRVADKYDPDWKAWIDGKKADVMRADFIFLGVYVESGMHEVLLEYVPSIWPLVIQAVGFLFFAGAAGILLGRRKTNVS